MKHVVRFAKAIPWRGIGKFSFKALSLLAFGVASIILFIVRFVAAGDRKTDQDDDFWSPVGPDAQRRRPDLYRTNGE